MFTWLNENEGAVVGLATIALVLVTIAYVWLTHRLVKQSRAARVGTDLAVLAITSAGEVGLSEPAGLRHASAAHVVNVGNGPAVQLDAKLRLGDLRMRACDPPEEIVGVAQAYEPREGRMRTRQEVIGMAGSKLEERFDFYAPPGWQPPEAPQSARVVVQWRDALGEHRATSKQTGRLQGRTRW